MFPRFFLIFKEKVLEKFLVTSALPYANGKLHIGHVAGAYLPADIFVRFQKLQKNDVLYVCGTDEHGAPISIKAEKEGVKPEDIVERYHTSIKGSFDGLGFNFDNFSGTARAQHHKLSQHFFTSLLENKFITIKTNDQFYCEQCKRFLADRYVEGICPHCGKEGARGDQCDHCGQLLDAIELGNPQCKICGSTPIIKATSHWFLELPKMEQQLKEWLETKKYWKDNVHRFIMNWLKEGLIERAITRDIDWGVPVPLEDSQGKVLYVWFDAPIGYISSTIEWANKIGQPEKWKEYWLDENTKLIHFIGKDNIPFHTIIWPAILMGQKEKYILPYDVPANEYLNLEGKKISTSNNYAIWVEDFLKYFDGEYLRYYLATNAPETKDSDFVWKEFQQKINSELANVLGNLANRTFSFSKKYFNGEIQRPENLSNNAADCLQKGYDLSKEIQDCYKNYKVRKVTQLGIQIVRNGNVFFDLTKPWVEVKNDKSKAAETLYVCSELLRIISIVFSPIIPNGMKKLRNILNLSSDFYWDNIENNQIQQTTIGEVKPLFPKIDDKAIEEQILLLETNTKTQKDSQDKVLKIEHKKEIDFEDFLKLEIRIVKIISAEKIKKSKKLLKLKVQFANEERDVVAGLSLHYKPEDLIDKKVTMLLNLKPRKIMGQLSQGMILAAEGVEGKLSVLIPEKDIIAGSLIS